MNEFIEKIAQVKIVHDDDNRTEFGHFFAIQTFPVSFDLRVSITFLNIIPNKNYRLKIKIATDTSPLTIVHNDSQAFSISEKDMILVHDNLGQSFIVTGIRFDVLQENAYKTTFILTDEKGTELSIFTNYYYFGGTNSNES